MHIFEPPAAGPPLLPAWLCACCEASCEQMQAGRDSRAVCPSVRFSTAFSQIIFACPSGCIISSNLPRYVRQAGRQGLAARCLQKMGWLMPAGSCCRSLGIAHHLRPRLLAAPPSTLLRWKGWADGGDGMGKEVG